MLNVLLGLLLAVNAVFWLWSQNHFALLGWAAPNTQPGAAQAEAPIEPQRIHELRPGEPDTLAVVNTPGIDTAHAPQDWHCWNLGPFSPATQVRLQNALPLNSEDLRWSVVDTVLPQRWVVVSERSTNIQTLNRLVQQAKDQGLDHRTSDTDVLRGRLILGTFINRDLAVKALSNLLDQGWGPLSVMRERPPLPAVLVQAHVASDAALQGAQQALTNVPVLGAATLQSLPCDDSQQAPTPTASTPPAEAATSQ